MGSKDYLRPAQLEKYSFFWSEARLLIAAVALLIGGYPPALAFTPRVLYGIISPLLTLAWIISGVVSAYLFYRWNLNKQVIFGRKDNLDTVAFFINVVSGLNLGIAGLLGTNIGMSISSSKIVFIVVGIIYLATAWHLYQRWTAFGKKIF